MGRKVVFNRWAIKWAMRQGRTLSDIAKAAGMSVGTLHDLAYGRRENVTIDTINKLAAALRVEGRELVVYWPERGVRFGGEDEAGSEEFCKRWEVRLSPNVWED